MNKKKWYLQQKVQPSELSDFQDDIDAAIRQIAADFFAQGWSEQPLLVENDPSANFTVDLKPQPGLAILGRDLNGQRIYIPAKQDVDLAALGVTLPTAGQEKYVSVIVEFSRDESDPREDGNGDPLMYEQSESFTISVVQGTAAAAGTALRPNVPTGKLLCGDILLDSTSTVIVNAMIDQIRVLRGSLASLLSRANGDFALNSGAKGVPLTAAETKMTWLRGSKNSAHIRLLEGADPETNAPLLQMTVFSDSNTFSWATLATANQAGGWTDNGGYINTTTPGDRVKIGAAGEPAASADLELASVTKGFLLNRLTDTQIGAVASPAEGLLVYSTTDKRVLYFDGTDWITLAVVQVADTEVTLTGSYDGNLVGAETLADLATLFDDFVGGGGGGGTGGWLGGGILFVDPLRLDAADDTNLTTPFASINGAISQLTSSNQVIIVAPGTYTENISLIETTFDEDFSVNITAMTKLMRVDGTTYTFPSTPVIDGFVHIKNLSFSLTGIDVISSSADNPWSNQDIFRIEEQGIVSLDRCVIRNTHSDVSHATLRIVGDGGSGVGRRVIVKDSHISGLGNTLFSSGTNCFFESYESRYGNIYKSEGGSFLDFHGGYISSIKGGGQFTLDQGCVVSTPSGASFESIDNTLSINLISVQVTCNSGSHFALETSGSFQLVVSQITLPGSVKTIDPNVNTIFYNGEPKGELWLSAAGGWGSITNGADNRTQLESTTNKVNQNIVPFADAATEYLEWTGFLPHNYDGGTIQAQFYWRADTASTNGVAFLIQGNAYGNNEVVDLAWPTAVTVVDNNTGQNKINISDLSSALTLSGTPVAGELVQFRVNRNSANGSDTLAADAQLIGVRVQYNLKPGFRYTA